MSSWDLSLQILMGQGAKPFLCLENSAMGTCFSASVSHIIRVTTRMPGIVPVVSQRAALWALLLCQQLFSRRGASLLLLGCAPLFSGRSSRFEIFFSHLPMGAEKSCLSHFHRFGIPGPAPSGDRNAGITK